MAMSKLTIRDKRMLGLILALVFIMYFLKRFYPQGFLQVANAINVNPEQLDTVTNDLSQVGEGYVLFRVLGAVLQKGWVKTVAVWGSLLYAIEGLGSLLGFDLSTAIGRRMNNSNG
jgi:hypothetical protein